MKTYLGVLISLLSTFLVSNGQITSAGVTVNVAKTLVRLFSKDEEKVTDLTAADELARGLTFDKFKEKISNRVSRGILLKDYPTIIERFAQRFSIPSDVKESLLDALMVDDLTEIVQNFEFEKGKTGTFVYGRVATIKHGEKIDMAYSVYTLEFKISPSVIEHKKTKRFLGIKTGTKVWYETKERNLSTEEKDRLKNHLMIRAIASFRSEYAGLIEASEYCDVRGNCD